MNQENCRAETNSAQTKNSKALFLLSVLCVPARNAAILFFVCAGAVHAASADDLLRQVQESSRAAAMANQEREQRFLKNRDQQAELLRQAESELAVVRARADRVKQSFEVRQKEITDLKNRIQGRSGDLAQLFTTARQSAADFRVQANESLISAQFPQRLQFLSTLVGGESALGIDELERFWFILQQELTEDGKVARFKADIVDPDGAKREDTVVRVGAFTAFSKDTYLFMPSGSGHLVAINPQPDRSLRGLAADFVDTEDDWAQALIDPSRGALLVSESQRPDPLERVEQGGVVGYVVILLGVIGALVSVYQLIFLSRVGRKVATQLQNIAAPRDDNPLGRVLASLRGEAGIHDPEVLEVKLSEAVLKETPKLERFQSGLRMIVAAGPLLGLLGTVTGMIITFQVITEVGAADPKLMAGGISQAMVTTVLGIGIAIPLLFINVLLGSRSRSLIQILDEQSAGLLARELEARRIPAAKPRV